MLAPPPHLKGPLPKHTPRLVGSLRDLGCEVVVEHWGRHHDVETIQEKLWGRIGDIRRTRHALAQLRPDMLVIKTSHDWNTVVRDVLLLIATRGRRPSTVVQLHGSRPEKLLSPGSLMFKHMSRWLIQLSNAVLVLSTDEQVKWQRFYPAGKFYRVDNPFVHQRQRLDVSRGTLPSVLEQLDRDVPVILFVGRLIPEKGILDLIYAFATIRDSTSACLIAAGDGPQAFEVATLVRSLGLEKRVFLPGYLHGEELEAVYAGATAFALPTWWIEGFPTVIAEAMNAGLPIITTAIRGMADHLQEGTNALFVPPSDPEALGAAILRLLNDRSLCAHMSIANCAAVKKFSPDLVAQEYLHVLQSVIEERVA